MVLFVVIKTTILTYLGRIGNRAGEELYFYWWEQIVAKDRRLVGADVHINRRYSKKQQELIHMIR